MSKGTNIFTTPPNGTPNVTPNGTPRNFLILKNTYNEQSYKDLATRIVFGFYKEGFNAVIFDFDGTLTKYHTARKRSQEIDQEDWFADKEILKKILEEGFNGGIKFYIASKQSPEIIEVILGSNDLSKYFCGVYGEGFGTKTKLDFINEIAGDSNNKKILYFDDDPELEVIGNEKITFIEGLLETLDAKEPAVIRKKTTDIDGDAGLKFEKWQQVATYLENQNYKVGYKPSFNSLKNGVGHSLF